MDLVEEEDRSTTLAAEPVPGALENRPDVARRVADTAESSSNAAPVDAATMRASVVLPLPGGP